MKRSTETLISYRPSTKVSKTKRGGIRRKELKKVLQAASTGSDQKSSRQMFENLVELTNDMEFMTFYMRNAINSMKDLSIDEAKPLLNKYLLDVVNASNIRGVGNVTFGGEIVRSQDMGGLIESIKGLDDVDGPDPDPVTELPEKIQEGVDFLMSMDEFKGEDFRRANNHIADIQNFMDDDAQWSVLDDKLKEQVKEAVNHFHKATAPTPPVGRPPAIPYDVLQALDFIDGIQDMNNHLVLKEMFDAQIDLVEKFVANNDISKLSDAVRIIDGVTHPHLPSHKELVNRVVAKIQAYKKGLNTGTGTVGQGTGSSTVGTGTGTASKPVDLSGGWKTRNADFAGADWEQSIRNEEERIYNEAKAKIESNFSPNQLRKGKSLQSIQLKSPRKTEYEGEMADVLYDIEETFSSMKQHLYDQLDYGDPDFMSKPDQAVAGVCRADTSKDRPEGEKRHRKPHSFPRGCRRAGSQRHSEEDVSPRHQH